MGEKGGEDCGRSLSRRRRTWRRQRCQNWKPWDPHFQKFCFAFSLWGYDVEVDPEQRRIITTARDAQTHITNYYEYDENGTLRLVDTGSESCPASQNGTSPRT